MSEINVIGLGSAGCNIALQFEKYPQYRVFKLDKEGEKAPNFYRLKSYDHPELYEKNPPKLKTFFRKVKGEVLFVVSGSGIVSGATLVILEHLKRCKISILYVKPDTELLSEIRTLQERVVYNVLQEYTISGVFKEMMIVDNNQVERMLGSLPIKEYYSKINEAIVSTIHTINVFKHSQSVLDNFSCHCEDANIATLAAVNIEDGEEKLFFDLEYVKEKCYYIGAYNEDLEKDGELFTRIKEQMKSKRTGNIKISYGIYEVEHNVNYAFCILRSPAVQRG